MFGWIFARWHGIQREIDRHVLWPSCKEKAEDLHQARAAFAHHAFNDPAWLVLGQEEIIRQIDELH